MTNNKMQAGLSSVSLNSIFLPNNRTAPLQDDVYFKMMTVDEKEHTNPRLVEIVLKFYPGLSRLSERKANYVNELISHAMVEKIEEEMYAIEDLS
jgi:hypothetical protein